MEIHNSGADGLQLEDEMVPVQRRTLRLPGRPAPICINRADLPIAAHHVL
jgi:hypothetical protein